MIDCSHGNSQKDHRRQADVAASICEQVAGGSLADLRRDAREPPRRRPAGLRARPARPSTGRASPTRASRSSRPSRCSSSWPRRSSCADRSCPPSGATTSMADSRDPGVPGIAGAAIAPPIEPMLAKLADDAARRRRLPVRAEVGRLPRHRVPRRRRRVHPEPRPAAARPLLPRAARRAADGASADGCVVDGEIVIADAARARLRRAAAAPAPGRLARREAGRRRRRRRSSPSTCWRSDGRDLRDAAAGTSAARGSSSCSRDVAAAGPPHADDARPRAGRATGSTRFEGAGPRRRDRQARSTRTYQPGKRAMIKVKHARTADCVVAGFRWHKSGERRGRLAAARPLRRPRARCTTSASRRRSRWPCARQLAEELAPLRENALDGHPVARLGRGAGASATRMPGGAEPLERRQGPVVGAAAHRARVRGEVRPPAGRPLPPRGDLPALAAGQAAGATAATTSSRSRRRTSSRRSSAPASGSHSLLPVLGQRILVGIERLLRRPQRLRHVLQVDADARPGAGSGRASRRRARRRARGARRPPGGAPSSARGRRARPPSARARPISISGCFGGRPAASVAASRRLRDARVGSAARDGATRGGSPACLR